ncbi:glycosyltransferase family 4 protein [Bradyrhizobium sp. 183]|nr:glycosyltransferase family 4 protein [Bradyrhizobium sp. 184]UPJ78940.1 glycosyltransferase family 4 protein [Bradyrhizobium sp. 184]UPJ86733.1 glycosyltransferase family 4 protein [Bradyrhizobium sp. 183]
MEALDRSERVEYLFVGSGEPFEGIVHVDPEAVRRFRRMHFLMFKRVLWQAGAIKLSATAKVDALVFLGNPNFLSTWIAAWISRRRHIPVLFWEHGWRRREGSIKSKLRLCFFELADRMLVYAPRAKSLGVAAGYLEERIDVVYNSLDVPIANHFYQLLARGELRDIDPASIFEQQHSPIIICTARLTEACRFDLLFKAVEILINQGTQCNILLVGDGPMAASLRALAAERRLPVHFFGACYEERTLSQLLYRSALTVSPGKVGLTAMHSLMYGTPVVTHDNDDDQMPEVEAIREGVTGARFRQNDPESLARVIARWLSPEIDRELVRSQCRAEIAARWSPDVQAQIIEGSILKAVSHGQA